MIIPDALLHDNTAYSVDDIENIYNEIRHLCSYVGTSIKYLNIPISVDLETSSFYDDKNQKTAIMYVWMIGIFGLVIMGRTWDEYMIAYNKLVRLFRTYGNKRHMIWYIHNASFDFQFIRKHHKFIKVFATGRYSPLYAITEEGVEYRCSYRLSGLSLDKLAKNLRDHKISKLIGDLDYDKIRHSKTPLSETEKGYCINDVKIVNAYIAECITDENENISDIPLTNTGYVRRDCRNACFKTWGYKEFIHNLSLTPDEFIMCRNAFCGGYTHSNPLYTRKILHDVTSLDISSSYPTVMVAEKYPMSSPKHATINKWSEFKYYMANYCCIFTVTIRNIKPRYFYDFYLSASKCEIIGKRTLSNGRVVYADELTTTITDIDWDIIEYMYKLNPNDIQIGEFIYFEKDYLPTPFVKQILTYYQKKTTLAGIPEYIAEYNRSKRMQNSCYGMTATNPIRDTVSYINDNWSEPITPEINSSMNKYNNSYNRFLYYPWAVYVTAYARHNIWSAIIECGDDHIYTDTDSEKCLNFSVHTEFFDRYNQNIISKLKIACKIHGINPDMVLPKNKKGDIVPLGIFKNEGTYSTFKTNGAKRYIYTIDNEMHITCAGVNPKYAIKYLQDIYDNEKDIYNAFDDELCIPPEYSGRKIHTYIDEKRTGKITDYMGIEAEYCELSGIHLEGSEYNLSIADEFIRFIRNVKEGVFDL